MADELEHASEALLSFKNGVIKTEVKEEVMEEFGPASLGLHRVGEAPPPKPQISAQPVLNRRGMPARIRKKNRLFFDDDVVSPATSVVPRSMLKTPRIKTPVKRGRKPKEPPEPAPLRMDNGDRKLGQKIGMRLRNLLKLPKAHKWVCYEWFYSNIDTALFSGENDFTICLKESFPQLKAYMLSRVEWCKMRRMMGKPRRCSQAFFEEERRELERKRAKIRQLQQRKPTDLNSCKDLPLEIPLQLVIGTKVTARLRTPQDGLFCGSIDAFDTSNNTYRITFERQGLGTHSIPDFEVLANEPIETISVMSMAHALRPVKHQGINNDVMGSTSDLRSEFIHNDLPTNGFPNSALELFVQLNKIIELKRSKVSGLREMNSEAERKQGFSEYLTEEFVKRYATSIIEIDQINIALRQLLSSVQKLCQQLLPDMSLVAMLTPNYLRNQSLEEAKGMVDRFKCSVSHSVLDLVIELTALVMQIKSLSENDRSSFEIEVLSRSMESIKKKLSSRNKNMFEKNIEVHMKQIQFGLSGEIGSFHSVLTSQ